MKSDVVYHGSARKLIGDKLEPRKAKAADGNELNSQDGIYATDIKNHAITMAILGSAGVDKSSLSMNDPTAQGIVFKGWPTNKEAFVYTLPSETFKPTGKDSHQMISYIAVKPINTEVIKVADYLHLIRKATEQDRQEYMEKHGNILD